jgi:hypothetical protein
LSIINRERFFLGGSKLPIVIRHAQNIKVATDDALLTKSAAVHMVKHHKAPRSFVNGENFERKRRAIFDAHHAARAFRHITQNFTAKVRWGGSLDEGIELRDWPLEK